MNTEQHKRIQELMENDKFCLIVLDACRYDYMEDVLDNEFEEFSWDTETIHSGVPNTHTWARKYWSGEYDLTYFSPIPFISDKELDGPTGGGSYKGTDHFERVINVWKDPSYEENRGVKPEVMRDAFIDNYADRAVVHFGQPHMPHMSEPKLFSQDMDGGNLAQIAKSGEVPKDYIEKSYRANLVYVMKEGVLPLVSHIDHDNIVITADHGESLGEGGHWGHNTKTHWVQNVPWVEV